MRSSVIPAKAEIHTVWIPASAGITETCVGWVQRSGTHQPRATMFRGGGLRCTPPTLRATTGYAVFRDWIPASAGMTETCVGWVQRSGTHQPRATMFRGGGLRCTPPTLRATTGYAVFRDWIPASAGMTETCVGWVQRSGTHQPRPTIKEAGWIDRAAGRVIQSNLGWKDASL